MNYREKINRKEYDFLRNDPHLGNRIMLLTLGGSHAYGTNNENSDLDIRGITAEFPNEIIGRSNFEQVINHETDTTIYPNRRDRLTGVNEPYFGMIRGRFSLK